MASLFLGTLGFLFLLVGLCTQTGRFKTLYLLKGSSLYAPRSLRGVFIPMGIATITLGILLSDTPLMAAIDSRIRDRLFDCVFLMFAAVLVFAIWNPRWLRPRWLVYLEDEYGPVMWRLLEEAAKNPRAWEQQVSTHEDLVKWAEETCKQLGYPPHLGRSDREAKERKRRARRAKYKRTPEALQKLWEEKAKSERKKAG